MKKPAILTMVQKQDAPTEICLNTLPAEGTTALCIHIAPRELEAALMGTLQVSCEVEILRGRIFWRPSFPLQGQQDHPVCVVRVTREGVESIEPEIVDCGR